MPINQRRTLTTRIVERLFYPRNGLLVFCFALGLVYGIVPFALWLTAPVEDTFAILTLITFCSIAAMAVGSRLPLFDHRFRFGACRLFIPHAPFILVIWGIFLLFIVVTLLTAPSIPFISALKGVSASELSQERGEFLKGRQGAEIALLYISTFLVSTLIPYSVVLLYHTRSRIRHISALLFFAFCISFMQKTLFLNLILPLVAYFAISRKLRGGVIAMLLTGSFALLTALTFLSVSGETLHSHYSPISEYYSAAYAPSSPLDYLFWRAASVPVFTATDTLTVFDTLFDSEPLMGATSSLLSAIFGLDRINIERHVFEHQFGSWNEIANANAVFVIDAFVNFGSLGVILFGLAVGQIFRWFRLSNDVAFKSLWPLFAFTIFSAPLIGMLLSNGFLYMLIHALFIRVGKHDAKAI